MRDWKSELVMGPGQNFLTQIRSGQFFCDLGWVSHLWFGFGLGKFHLKMSIFLIFSLWVKKNLFGWVKGRWASYLLRIKSMLRSGQGPSLSELDVMNHSFKAFFILMLFYNNIKLFKRVIWPELFRNYSKIFCKIMKRSVQDCQKLKDKKCIIRKESLVQFQAIHLVVSPAMKSICSQ